MSRYQTTILVIYTLNKLTAINSVTRNTSIHVSNYWNMPMNKYVSYIAHICPTPILMRHLLQWDNRLLHTCIKNYKLQLLFTILLQNTGQQQICPSNAIYMPYTPITWCAPMGSMPIYKPHMNSMALTTSQEALYADDDDDARWWRMITMMPQPNYIH